MIDSAPLLCLPPSGISCWHIDSLANVEKDNVESFKHIFEQNNARNTLWFNPSQHSHLLTPPPAGWGRESKG